MTNESKTLFIPLYGKAMMSRKGFFTDKTAERIADSIEYDFADVDKSEKLAIYMAMRAMQYDELAEQFIQKYPDSIVIHLGCGLDSRCVRLSHTPKMWYDLDFPDVIELRKKYYTENVHYGMIESSVTDLQWLDSIDHNGEQVLVIAEGLSMYLTEDEVAALMDALGTKFGKVTLLMDAYSKAAAKLSKIKNPINAVDAQISFAMSDPTLLEQRCSNAKCVLNNDIILPKYIERLNGSWKTRFKFMGRFGASFYRIYGYRIRSST